MDERETNELMEGIEIRETIGGDPVADATVSGPSATDGLRSRRTRKPQPAEGTTRARSSSAQPETSKTAALAKKAGRPDPYLWGIYIMLLMISVVELFSASSSEVSGTNIYGPLIRHGIFLVLGLGIVLWLQRTPYTLINKFAWVFAGLSLALLILSSVIGVNINGAQRAINIAGFTIQPPEIVKLAVVILLASILGKNQTPGGVTNKGVFIAAFVVLVFSGFLWKNGLTNTILLMGVSFAMFLIGGIQWKKIGLVAVCYALCLGALISMKHIAPSSNDFDEVVTQQEMIAKSGGGVVNESAGGKNEIGRSETWKFRVKRYIRGVHPEDPIDDMNRQVIFAKFAQANGGLMGQGPGNSRESARLPLAFSDYIYSIIIEDTGFVGGAAVLLLFMFLVARAGRIAYKCSRAFPAFLIMGCAVMIVFQAMVHMAIVTGLFPVSGQPLPFISKGGTSVLVMSAALGIMLSVSRFAAHGSDKKKISAELNALPEDMSAANYSAGGTQQ